MSTVPTIISHFASSNVTTPGFAMPGGSASHTCGITPSQGSNSPSNVAITGFFTNASSSYQSHFGDFSGGGVNMGIVPCRSSSNASNVSTSVGVVGGCVPPNTSSAVKSPRTLPVGVVGSSPLADSAPIPAAPTPSATTAAGASSSCSAPMPISGRPSTASSHSNSPRTLSITPTVKFASPIAVETPPKTTPTLGATSAGNLMGELIEGAAAAEARHSSLSSGTSLDAASLSTGGTPSSTANISNNNNNVTSAEGQRKAGAVAQGDMDEEVLSDAHKYAMLNLSTASGAGGCCIGGVSLSPTSPDAPHSRTLSSTSTTSRVDLMMSPVSSTQPSGQQQPGGSSFLPTVSLTPLSAQSSGSRHSNHGSREPMVSVYDSDFKMLLSIPPSQVVHRPHPSLGVSRLVLCRNYSPENPGNCSKGELCKFVHADISNTSRCSIHVNYACRSLESCSYPRLPAGDHLTILAPNERPPSEVIPSERILVTRGSTNWREHTAPLSHCAHYYFNRMCNRGERCNFIHAVHVDPNVQGDFKRAPAPTAVAPIISKSPTTSAMRSANNNSGGGNSTRAASGATLPPPPPPPLPPQQQCNAFSFVPNVYTPPPPPPPPGAMAYPLSNSPTGGNGPYMMFASSGGATGFVPATLVPPPPSHLGNSNGVYLLVPAHSGLNPNGGGTPTSPVSPLGQSFGSVSNGPIEWSFYGDLETSAWMPPSPSQRM